MFIGRDNELEILDDLFSWKDKGHMVAISGRRRIGKTALIEEWIKKRNPSRVFYWYARVGTAQDQLARFSRALYEFQTGTPAPAVFTYPNWDAALETIGGLAAHDERLVVIIDEFTYLIASDSGVASDFQKVWDLNLKNKNILLIISGSYMGMMHDYVLSPKAPLYQRAQRVIQLQPLTFGHTKEYFKKYNPDERMFIYAVFGGVPGFWERINQDRTPEENLIDLLLTSNSPMHGEPRLLLHDHVTAPSTYVSILRAIAEGNRRSSEVAAVTGMAATSLPPYIQKLESIGLIERRRSLAAGPKTKMRRYYVSDPFLRFYFRFVENRIPQFRLGENKQALAEINKHMVDFIGANTWEEVCREWTLRAGTRKIIPVLADEVGEAWKQKEVQIDVYGPNPMNNSLVLGECKWTNKPIGQGALVKLIENQADKIVPKNRNWEVFFIGFSRSGWTQTARDYAKEVGKKGYGGKKWNLIGTRLLSLDEVDEDLARFVN